MELIMRNAYSLTDSDVLTLISAKAVEAKRLGKEMDEELFTKAAKIIERSLHKTSKKDDDGDFYDL